MNFGVARAAHCGNFGNMNSPAVQSTIDGLKGIYTIVLALAIGEAFKQFVVDRGQRAEERHVQWDRFPGLLSFLLLIVPFYHGIVRYFFEAYNRPTLPAPYSVWLSVDCLAFMIEAILFFVMSRSLSLIQWKTFYYTVMVLCAFDFLWVLVDKLAEQPTLTSWLFLDLGTFLGVAAVAYGSRRWEPKTSRATCWRAIVPVLLILARTVIDYGLNHSFYFPINKESATVVNTNLQGASVKTNRIEVYFAGPLFTQAQWKWNEQLAAELSRSNFDIILPQRRASSMLKGEQRFDPSVLFRENLSGIDRSDVVVAVLDEADPDSGTSWECGYAYKCGRPVIGLRTDIRRAGDDADASVNLMLSRSCKKLIQVPFDRLDDFPWVVQKIKSAVVEVVQK